MNERRRKFYRFLAAIFPVFFLLHWNGLFAQTYYWALEARGSTTEVGPQVTAALLSAIVIFAVVAAVFELVTRLPRPRA